MPRVITGSTDNERISIGSESFDYNYPGGLDLTPGKPLHEKLKKRILERARVSHDAISVRHKSWNKIDQVLTCYKKIDKEEELVKSKDDRKPVSIVFPYSYVVLETLLTYMIQAFGQDPIFKMEGTGPEDTLGAIMMEKIVQKHCLKNKVELTLHTMFRDSLAYGIGIVAPSWEVRRGKRTVMREEGTRNPFGRLFGKKPVEVEEDVLLFEGNSLQNIDPYFWLPDPNVSVHNIQKGEFCGWVNQDNYMNLLSDEQNDENIFNVRYLKKLKNRLTSITDENPSKRNQKSGVNRITDDVVNRVDVIYMYINLVPKDWGLSDSDYPEKWLFALAGDEVIIRAEPSNLNHGMYPIAVAAPDFDGYSAAPLSRLENLLGMQEVLDWLFNSHITNVRKAINDMLIVDPYLINVKDLQDPKAGKLIRMRRPAWGRGVEGAVKQLAVSDVTRQNIGDSSYVVSWMNQIAGADGSMMGSLRQGGPERLTGAEFSGTRNAAMTRLERIARVISLQAMQDIGYMFATHTQQFMSEEAYVATTGRWAEDLAKEFGIVDDKMKVSPKDIQVDFDIDVKDGSIPGSNFSDVWVRMFEVILKSPELGQRFDVGRIFQHIARNSGAKNVNEFLKQEGAQVMPDEEVMQNLQQGNIAPQ